MNKLFVSGLAATAMALLTATVDAQGARGAPDPTRYGWMWNYDEAKSLAGKSGKPLMVVFRCVP